MRAIFNCPQRMVLGVLSMVNEKSRRPSQVKYSVIVPCFNMAETIESCLKSIRASDFKDFEIILVDDGSTDGSCETAKKYADQYIRHPSNQGQAQARISGAMHARGDLCIFVDADVVIEKNSIRIICDYLDEHPDIAGVTGLLSEKHPHSNFFSQYKNLYMHYIFSNQSEDATFLYGSMFAVRKSWAEDYKPLFDCSCDVDLGQHILSKGGKLKLLKDLEVVHLKKYNGFSLMANDFEIPYHWAAIFMRYCGWKQWGRNGSGFAHASRKQLFSLLIACMIGFHLMMAMINPSYVAGLLVLVIFYIVLNYPFFKFLTIKRNRLFGALSVWVTLLDQWVMSCGILCGFVHAGLKNIIKLWIKK